MAQTTRVELITDHAYVHTFRTAHYVVATRFVRQDEHDIDLSWDTTGEALAQLRAGITQAFGTIVEVIDTKTLQVIGASSLWGSIYENPARLLSEHRHPNYAYRNTLTSKATNNHVAHYYPDLVREAIREARWALNSHR